MEWYGNKTRYWLQLLYEIIHSSAVTLSLNYLNLRDFATNIDTVSPTFQKVGKIFIVSNSNIVKHYTNLKELVSFKIYFEIKCIPVMAELNFQQALLWKNHSNITEIILIYCFGAQIVLLLSMLKTVCCLKRWSFCQDVLIKIISEEQHLFKNGSLS